MIGTLCYDPPYYDEEFSKNDITKIRTILLVACKKDKEFAKEVRSNGFHFCKYNYDSINSTGYKVFWEILKITYDGVNLRNFDVMEIHVSPYLVVFNKELALSLVNGGIVGTENNELDEIVIGVLGETKSLDPLRVLSEYRWSSPKPVNDRLGILRCRMSDIGNALLVHLKEGSNDTDDVEMATISLVSISVKGIISAKDSLFSETFSETLRAVVDTYGDNIKEVYFVCNYLCDDDRFFENVIAHENSDGEYSLLMY